MSSSTLTSPSSIDFVGSWHDSEAVSEWGRESSPDPGLLHPCTLLPLLSQNAGDASPLASQSPSQTAFTRSYHFEPATMANFQVEECHFRLDRVLLDQESHAFPQGVGSKEHPIQLPGVLEVDFAVLVHFLYYGTRFDKKPWTATEWLSIISVSTRYTMNRVRNLAYKALFELLDPVDQIVFAQSQGIPEVLVPGYAALCSRKEPLDTSEVSKLGSGVTALIRKEREENQKQTDESLRSNVPTPASPGGVVVSTRGRTELLDNLEVSKLEQDVTAFIGRGGEAIEKREANQNQGATQKRIGECLGRMTPASMGNTLASDWREEKCFENRGAGQKRIGESLGGIGFEPETCGLYFAIREKGANKYLGTAHGSNEEGTHLHLWTRGDKIENMGHQIFFIDAAGALCHAASGLAMDIVDDLPVLRRRRPVSGRPNPWSHPLPLFSFENSQIRVKFLSDPSLPSCTDDLYPKDSWATKDFVLATRTKKDYHRHPISDFSPWIPPVVSTWLPYDIREYHEEQWRVLVEERTGDIGDDRTSWEIVAAKYI